MRDPEPAGQPFDGGEQVSREPAAGGVRDAREDVEGQWDDVREALEGMFGTSLLADVDFDYETDGTD